MAKAKTDTKTKTKKIQPAAIEPFGPRVDMFNAQGKLRTADTSALCIVFTGGRNLILGLSNTVDGPITLVAEYADAGMHTMPSLRPKHHSSITLRTEAQPAELADSVEEVFGDDTIGAEMSTLGLIVQYGDELKAATHKALPKERDIEERAAPILFVDAQLNVRFVGEEEGRTLNHIYRGKGYAANVLASSYVESAESPVSTDIVLCCMVVEKKVKEQKKPLFAHYAHLIVHGALYAQGHDHEDAANVGEMGGIETEILRDLGFADPYAGH